MKRRNDITRKAMLPIIGRELSLIQAVQPATVRADPEAAVTGSADRDHVVVGESVLCPVVREPAVF